jgi:hypothetical protein
MECPIHTLQRIHPYIPTYIEGLIPYKNIGYGHKRISFSFFQAYCTSLNKALVYSSMENAKKAKKTTDNLKNRQIFLPYGNQRATTGVQQQ